MFDDNWLLLFTRPIALLFFVLTALGLFSPMIFKKITSRRLKTSKT